MSHDESNIVIAEHVIKTKIISRILFINTSVKMPWPVALHARWYTLLLLSYDIESLASDTQL